MERRSNDVRFAVIEDTASQLRKDHDALRKELEANTTITLNNTKLLIAHGETLEANTRLLQGVSDTMQGFRFLNMLAGWVTKVAILGSSIAGLWAVIHGKVPPPP